MQFRKEPLLRCGSHPPAFTIPLAVAAGGVAACLQRILTGEQLQQHGEFVYAQKAEPGFVSIGLDPQV